jgi:phosphatidate cytidylyltransferase
MGARVWSALVALTIALSSLHVPWRGAFYLVLAVGFWLGLIELGKLLGWGPRSLFASGAASLLAFALVSSIAGSSVAAIVLVSLAFVVGCAAVMARKVDRPHPAAFLGVGWVLMPVLALALMHGWWTGQGPNPVALYFIALWSSDSLALGFGKALGRHPIAPDISPGKTWEGAIGALLGAVALTLYFAPAFDILWTTGLILGAVVGILGTAGDLFESWMKRRQSVKDSGGIMPGHGGILDRVDSMMMTAIPALVILVVLEPQLFHVKQLWETLLR